VTVEKQQEILEPRRPHAGVRGWSSSLDHFRVLARIELFWVAPSNFVDCFKHHCTPLRACHHPEEQIPQTSQQELSHRLQLRAGTNRKNGLVHLVRDQVHSLPTGHCQEATCSHPRSAGYALFKAHNKKLLKDGDQDMNTVEGAVNALKLKKFSVQLLHVSPALGTTNARRNSRMPSLRSTKLPP